MAPQTVTNMGTGGDRGGGGGDENWLCSHVCILNLEENYSGGGCHFSGRFIFGSLFLMHKCLNRDHHSCDKPLKAKVFFILYPTRAV